MGEVEELGRIGDVEGWASLVVGDVEGENEPWWWVLEDVGDPVLMFNVRTLCSPSIEFVFQHRAVLGWLGCAMGMHPKC